MRRFSKLRLPALESGIGDPIFGHCLFTDGARRPVFQRPEGQQYVVEEGERIDGRWLELEDGPGLNAPFG